MEWQPGLPLRIFEDPNLAIPSTNRAEWLSRWHTETEWLEALHRTTYSNGLIGLHEQMARHPLEGLSADDPKLSDDERLSRRLRRRAHANCVNRSCSWWRITIGTLTYAGSALAVITDLSSNLNPLSIHDRGWQKHWNRTRCKN